MSVLIDVITCPFDLLCLSFFQAMLGSVSKQASLLELMPEAAGLCVRITVVLVNERQKKEYLSSLLVFKD